MGQAQGVGMTAEPEHGPGYTIEHAARSLVRALDEDANRVSLSLPVHDWLAELKAALTREDTPPASETGA